MPARTKFKSKPVVGEGTYGRVAKCVQMANKKIVAIKMIKDQDQKDLFKNQELAALQKLKACNSSKYNIVEWYQAFTVRGHLCLEFEFLEKSLLDLFVSIHWLLAVPGIQ
uniref:Protein kinase domain-containing protein n=1 Tax=Haplochromis burtoni TaxID=8153 RepID=A0A3Q3C7X3_HAPBU